MIISNGELINIHDVIEMLNVRIVNAIRIRDKYPDRTHNRWYEIVEELCEIRDQFEALILK